MNTVSIALHGLQNADFQLNKTAGKIATASTQLASPPGADTFDFSSTAVSLLAEKNQFAATGSTIKVANDTQKALLDITA